MERLSRPIIMHCLRIVIVTDGRPMRAWGSAETMKGAEFSRQTRRNAMKTIKWHKDEHETGARGELLLSVETEAAAASGDDVGESESRSRI